ncbi:hypothetical protein OIDMADRAFT_142991 [Oidiodendron maius Zn]|uniref:Prion-inhibition and propagation HeLo domain-containing protein n=1 Tax=Oidiodendron maius (strain Zn) TaxID=913774 RepID=A0A0C3HAT9_OIDMZ|nr:hypothetical protein OIDMADRAFT_142991 [Oidiodendron maius Zn]
MAEAIGLVVGFVGLAGLFSTCVDCFKLVQVYDSRSADYEILQTMLDNQQFHFMAWGKACGFMDPDRMNSRFNDAVSDLRNERIEETMEGIKSLLTNGDHLKEKYGLKHFHGLSSEIYSLYRTRIEEETDAVTPEIRITHVPSSEWRKLKPRAGILPWLKVLVIMTNSPATAFETPDDIRPLSQASPLDGDPESVVRGKSIRLAINSRTLLNILKKISGFNVSPKNNVLVYPFKPLLVCYTSLRRYVDGTKDKLEKLGRLNDYQSTGLTVEYGPNGSNRAGNDVTHGASGTELGKPNEC